MFGSQDVKLFLWNGPMVLHLKAWKNFFNYYLRSWSQIRSVPQWANKLLQQPTKKPTNCFLLDLSCYKSIVDPVLLSPFQWCSMLFCFMVKQWCYYMVIVNFTQWSLFLLYAAVQYTYTIICCKMSKTLHWWHHGKPRFHPTMLHVTWWLW